MRPKISQVLFLATIGLFLSSASFGQGFIKKLFKKKEKAEIQTATIEKETVVEEIASTPFLLSNGEIDCAETQLLEQLPTPYQRENLNEKETCPELIEIQAGKFVDATYINGFDYYKAWDNYNVNPYNISHKVLSDSVRLHLYDSADAATAWAYPLDKPMRVTSKYGFRRWRFHHGVDVKVAIGDSIRSMFDGVVRIAKYNRRGYGYYVMVRHKNGLESLYGHMSRYIVKPGQEVKAGEVIGLGGNTGRSTGPHLHFEIRYQGYGFNPSDMVDFAEHKIEIPSDFDLTAKNYELLIESKKSVYHRIRPGDSLWKISRKYGTSITKICRLNGMSKRTTLRVGRTIRVR
ncbi:peptidoglycan DD-metalloendopeptidase family protein [Flammeovirga yaeyamensis]|uniref:Peptidoglycan DD-metalloendopeptidase family protein n=1 Tax=Flammeovirga yaeyamensis TaxID=367791 RepID=A0AAX1N072_9BACT|nr:M23 family metallopeptidase [Flammeovirga yaeyamensis]MBB3698671.1 murein DD-endopeptidase MepM/ murein hydrolase activator NlpD [Flammeovirga yaeyamensis]NMF33984.1 peptidoglycan DD-metalloendopeptidase family protein [Flammeovirga yaeyamensis]QWG00973.1 peptidoglycan DD-metalloendopeptidase family protein [Flammeovirga yaeyamensis]